MKRIVVLPDIHVPNENVAAVEATIRFIKHYKPTHLVQLGDFCDWDSVASYEVRREKDVTQIDKEVEASNDLLDVLDKAVGPKCQKFMVGGNHEDRYEHFKVNHGFELAIRRLKDFGSWHKEYRLDERGWGHCDYGDFYEIGHIVFTHGWYTGGTHAKKHLGLWHKNVIYGHTHEFQVATGTGLNGLPVMAASIGTLSRFNLAYLRGKPPVNWLNMFAYIDMRDDGTFTPHFVPIVDGKFIELGKEF